MLERLATIMDEQFKIMESGTFYELAKRQGFLEARILLNNLMLDEVRNTNND